MKIHIPAFVAIAALTATTAFGQYTQQAPLPQQAPQPQQYQQQQQPQQPQQYQQPRQNWRAPIVQTGALRTPANSPAMPGNYSSVVEGDCGGSCGDQYCNCDSQCGAECGGQCGGGKCGSGCGGRGQLGERLRSRSGGRGNQSDDYNPCCSNNYVSIFGGAATFNDIDFHLGITPAGGPTDDVDLIVGQNAGWTIGGAVGRRIRRRVRAEYELSYRNATFDEAGLSLNGVDQGTTNLDGQLNIYRSMANVLFDLNPGGRFNAYFGGGLGVGFVDLDATEPTTPITARLQSSSWIYQGIVGMSGKINQRAELFVDYRYFGTDQFQFDAGSPIGGLRANVDITSNDIFVGIRINR